MKKYNTIQEFIYDIEGKDQTQENNVPVKSKTILEDTLNRAYEIRSIELDLYWRRATFFWQ